MDVFDARKLALAFDIPYPTAERIIREAMTKYGRRWVALTFGGCACAMVGLAYGVFDRSAHMLASHLWFVAGIVLMLLQWWMTRRAARQPILDAASDVARMKPKA